MAETAPARTPRSANPRERRTKPRKSAEDLSLVTVEMGTAGFGLMLDVAEGGVGVQVMHRVEPGTGVQIAFKVPDLPSKIEGTGVVTWCDDNDGRIGIRFEQLSASTSHELKQWVDSLPEAPASEPVGAQLHPVLKEQAHTVQREIAKSHLDVDLMLQYLVERVVELTNSNGGAIALGHGEVMVCRASTGLAPDVGATIGSGSALTSECLRTGRAVRCDDTEVDTRVNREICRELNLRSSLILPIVFEHQIHGVVEIFSPAPYAFNERHQKLLQQLADFTAQVVYGPMPASAAEIQSSAKANAKPEHTVLSALLAATTMRESGKPGPDAVPLDVVPTTLTSPPASHPIPQPKPEPPVVPAKSSPSNGVGAAVQTARITPPEASKPTTAPQTVAPQPLPATPKETLAPKEPVVAPKPADVVKPPATVAVKPPATAKDAVVAPPVEAPKQVPPPKPAEIAKPQAPAKASEIAKLAAAAKELAAKEKPKASAKEVAVAQSVVLPLPVTKETNKELVKDAAITAQPSADHNVEPLVDNLPVAAEGEDAQGIASYRNVFIAIAVLIIVALGWFFFARGKSKTPAPVASAPATPQQQQAAPPQPVAAAVPATPASRQASTPKSTTPTTPAEVAADTVRSPNAAVVKADQSMPLIIAPGKRPPTRPDIVAEAPSIAVAGSPNLTTISLPGSTSRPELQAQGVVTGGNLLKRVEPVYPDFAKLQRLSGDVVISARVTKDGTLDRIKRVKGNPVFEPASINAVRQWRYDPYKLNGQPQDVDITITLQFRLKQ